jgi:hypothetical protein
MEFWGPGSHLLANWSVTLNFGLAHNLTIVLREFTFILSPKALLEYFAGKISKLEGSR